VGLATVLGIWTHSNGELDPNKFEFESNRSNFIWYNHDFPVLRKILIKYGCEGFAERNDFLYRNFFIFKLEFELKIGKLKVWFGL
jgi:hypothetical protein